MSEDKEKIINPIDPDTITETPSTLTYGHHRGSAVVMPTEKGQIKGKALSAMEHQTDMQLLQLKQQMELIAEQANKIQSRIAVSEQIYGADMGFEPLINHIYPLYQRKDNQKFLLSLIAKDSWSRRGCPYDYIATVQLLADHTWDVLEQEGAF